MSFFSFSALERDLDEHKDNSQLALLYFPRELFCKRALEEDLDFFTALNGDRSSESLCRRYRTLPRFSTPELLAAHAYPVPWRSLGWSGTCENAHEIQ